MSAPLDIPNQASDDRRLERFGLSHSLRSPLQLQKLATANVGVASLVLAVLMVVAVVRRLLRTVDELADEGHSKGADTESML